MKKLGLLVMPLMAISLLVSCGGSNPHKDEEYEVTFSVPEREDTILYGDKTQTVKWGEAPTKPKKDPYRVGYKFTGWYKDEECSKAFDFQKDHIEGTTTLYSGWEEDPKFSVPLCFTSNVDDNTITIGEDLYYKKELNDDWEKGKGETLPLNEGDKVYIGSDGSYLPSYFSLPTQSYNASGNIMSLINHINFKFLYGVSYCQFENIFRGFDDKPSHIVDAGDLLLPATKLANYCYHGMFCLCEMLIKAPQLPASTLVPYCYYEMFSLCEKLTEAPELPATTLANYCYESMFEGCTKLTEAPELPATTLVEKCYDNMFDGCENLDYVKVGFGDGTNWPEAEYCTGWWLDGVSASGTFIWRGSSEGPSTRDESTVPEGWTIETY